MWTQFNFSATGSFNYCNCFSSPVTHFKCTSTDACWEPVTFGLGAGDTVMKTHSRFRGARNRHPFVVHTPVRTGSPWATPGSGPEASASTEGGLVLVPVWPEKPGGLQGSLASACWSARWRGTRPPHPHWEDCRAGRPDDTSPMTSCLAVIGGLLPASAGISAGAQKLLEWKWAPPALLGCAGPMALMSPPPGVQGC